MNKIITQIILCACFAALELSGCGGASDTATESTSIISAGTVARSIPGQTGQLITVNKVVFGIAGASITLNGEPAVQEDVKPGMQVTITGSIEGSSGAASRIEIEGELEGMVEQVDTATRTITILDQTVQINEQTVFEGINSLDTLVAGQMIEVHGFPDAAGVVTATRVEVRLAAESQYFSGNISNLDSVTRTFAIRTIMVDYAEAALPSQPLADGLAVKVRGTYTNGIMAASGIRVRHSHFNHRGHAEREGFVTDYNASAGTFTLNGQRVQLTTTTTYEHGAVSEIVDGVKVEIKGEVFKGILTVRSIEVDGDHGLPIHNPTMHPPANMLE
jgi:hypothetical protein